MSSATHQSGLQDALRLGQMPLSQALCHMQMHFVSTCQHLSAYLFSVGEKGED